jgi:hypothetical protein
MPYGICWLALAAGQNILCGSCRSFCFMYRCRNGLISILSGSHCIPLLCISLGKYRLVSARTFFGCPMGALMLHRACIHAAFGVHGSWLLTRSSWLAGSQINGRLEAPQHPGVPGESEQLVNSVACQWQKSKASGSAQARWTRLGYSGRPVVEYTDTHNVCMARPA